MTSTALPKGPRRPGLVQTLEWVFAPESFMRRCAKRYGDTFTARLGPGADVVFLSDPLAARAVFHAWPELMNTGDINGLFRRVLGNNSLLVLDGQQHLRQRRLLLPPFSGDAVARHYGAMVAAAEEDVARWPVGEPMALQPRMQAMTLNVILGAVFGVTEGPHRDYLRRLLERLLELNTTLATTLPQLRMELGGLTPWAKLMRCTAEVDRAVYAEIAKRRGELKDRPADVLSLLLQSEDENGEPMSDQELRDQLLTTLVAGHETTATALAWVFERVLRHPEALGRIREELGRSETAYLDAAISETLRLRPTVPITARKLIEPFEILGCRYAAGTVLMPCIFLLHRNPAVHENAEAFRPERFLGADQPPPYSYIPFGGGVRRCPGSGFAVAEIRAVMQTVLSRVELRPVSRRSEKMTRRAFTLSPGKGARVMVTARL